MLRRRKNEENSLSLIRCRHFEILQDNHAYEKNRIIRMVPRSQRRSLECNCHAVDRNVGRATRHFTKLKRGLLAHSRICIMSASNASSVQNILRL